MGPMYLKIRTFTENDKQKVIKIWRLVFKNDPHWNEPNAIIERKLAIQRNLFLVGEVNGKIVATVLGGYDGFRGWVYHLAILPTHQRKGIGKALILKLEKKLKKYGVRHIYSKKTLIYWEFTPRLQSRIMRQEPPN